MEVGEMLEVAEGRLPMVDGATHVTLIYDSACWFKVGGGELCYWQPSKSLWWPLPYRDYIDALTEIPLDYIIEKFLEKDNVR